MIWDDIYNIDGSIISTDPMAQDPYDIEDEEYEFNRPDYLSDHNVGADIGLW